MQCNCFYTLVDTDKFSAALLWGQSESRLRLRLETELTTLLGSFGLICEKEQVSFIRTAHNSNAVGLSRAPSENCAVRILFLLDYTCSEGGTARSIKCHYKVNFSKCV